MTLASIPLAWNCARDGLATLIMTGFMLLAVADLARSRQGRSILWLALAISIKPLAIVLVLLIMTIYRSMSRRLLAGMIVLALSPLATQHPTYIIVQQYTAWLQNAAAAVHVGVVAHGWTTPFTALRSTRGIDVSEHIQMMIRLVAAIATLMLCGFTRQRYDAARSAVIVFSLTALYLMLFSPRTENNTYAMRGPRSARSSPGLF